MSNYIFFLGHQPHLSLAELESRFGADSIQESTDSYAVLTLNSEPNIDLLGGTTKISTPIKTKKLEQNTQEQIKNLILEFISEQKTSKLKLGISIHSGKNITQLNQKSIQKLIEEIRTEAKKQNPKLNLRTVEPKSAELNTAQIVHGGLLKTNGMSLDIIIENSNIALAQTTQVPNLKKYTLRDYGKPKPSGSNGMLPPKLAQILHNLSQIKPGQTVLDPFCGSGTVLQEALLQDINSLGTDLNPNIINDAQQNLEWLASHPSLGRADLRSKSGGVSNPLLTSPRGGSKFELQVADATTHTWNQKFDAVVCEGYLGKALSKEPSSEELEKITNECNQIAEGFLKNIHAQISTEQTIVIALPCWFFSFPERW